MTTETNTWFAGGDSVSDRLAALAGSAQTAEYPFVTTDDVPAGEVMGEFVERCLAAERRATASLEARGLRVVAASGTIAVVFVGLVALAPKGVPVVTEVLLVLGAGGALLSAAIAIGCASPKRTVDVDPASVEAKLSDQFWRVRSDLARRTVARSQLKVWEAVRALNNRLSRRLRTAVMIHVAGLAMVAAGGLLTVLR